MTPDAMSALYAAAFPDERPWTTAEFTDLINGPGGFFVSQPAGFAIGRAIAGEAELITLATDPTARRQGIGRALLSAFEARAAETASAAFLEVAADNAAARALYTTAGWQETGKRPRYYHRSGGAAVDAILMAKALS